MSAEAPLHEVLRPRLEALVREAEAAGYPRETVVAVLLDLISAPPYDVTPLDSENG